MADGNFDAMALGDCSVQAVFPQARAIAVAAPTVAKQQQAFDLPVVLPADFVEEPLYRGRAVDRIPTAKLRSELPKVIEVIDQNTPLEKRTRALMVLRFVRSRESARAFINAFTGDAEFREHLKSLRKPRP